MGAAITPLGAVYQLNLAAAGWFQADAGVENVQRVDPVGAVVLLLFLLAAAVVDRALRPAERRLR